MHRAVQIALLLLVLVHVGGPMFETVDEWDNFHQTGDDFVLSFLGVIISLGLMLLTRLWPKLLTVLSLIRSRLNPLANLRGPVDLSAWAPIPIPKSRPLFLRI
jgi:hypothetical protein